MRTIVLIAFMFVVAACTDRGGYYVETKPSAKASGVADGEVLILPLEVDPQVAEAFVRIGYGLDEKKNFQSTVFLTPRLRTVQATPLIRLVKEYNEFNGERVAAAVEKFRGRVSAVEFGREGSPVLYFELPYWTHQREEAVPKGMGTKITEAENEMFIAELRQLFVGELKADEFSVEHRRVRVWWD